MDYLYLDMNKRSVVKEFVSVSGDDNSSVTKMRMTYCEQALNGEVPQGHVKYLKIRINTELQNK